MEIIYKSNKNYIIIPKINLEIQKKTQESNKNPIGIFLKSHRIFIAK